MRHTGGDGCEHICYDWAPEFEPFIFHVMVVDEIDWLQVIYGNDGSVNRSLEYVARRQFPHDENMADEAYNFAFDRVSKDNFSKLSSFKNKAKPSTYLIKIFTNLVTDFHRSRHGRCSPPDWLKTLGPAFVSVFKKLCCEHVSRQEILHAYSSSGELELGTVEAMISRILRSVPSCLSRPSPAAMKVNVEDEDQLDAKIPDNQAAAAPDLELGSDGLISALWLYISPDQHQLDADQLAKLMALKDKWLSDLNLTADEKLLLRKVKVEDISVREAAAELRLEYHTAIRSLKRAVQKVHDLFAEAGIDDDDLR